MVLFHFTEFASLTTKYLFALPSNCTNKKKCIATNLALVIISWSRFGPAKQHDVVCLTGMIISDSFLPVFGSQRITFRKQNSIGVKDKNKRTVKT